LLKKQKLSNTCINIDDQNSPQRIIKKKSVAIESPDAQKADFEKMANSLNLISGSKKHQTIKLLCENKNSSVQDIKLLFQRIKNLSDEQLKILEFICVSKDFTNKDILSSVQSIKKFSNDRLLMLRSFCDLEGVGPGQLHQFFRISLPQSKRKEVGKKAYENELKEKWIRPDQINVFYNICDCIEGITPRTAITILPKIRQLKQQHTQKHPDQLPQFNSFNARYNNCR